MRDSLGWRPRRSSGIARRSFVFESLEARIVLSGNSAAQDASVARQYSSGDMIQIPSGFVGPVAQSAFDDASDFENFNLIGSRWPDTNGFGSLTVITYSYSNLFDGQMKGISSSDLRRGTEEAMRLWATYAPLHFVEVADSGPLPTSSDSDYNAFGRPILRFGHHFIDGGSFVLAHGFYPSTTGNGGDMHFDDGELWATNPNGAGIDFVEVCVHELGHALGIAHEFNVTAIMNPIYSGAYNGFGTAFLYQDDINAIQTLYGAGRGAVVRLSDVPAVVSSAISGPTSEAGTSATFNVRLSIQPTANVTINLASSNPAEGVPNVQQLEFTPENWDVPQTVGVTGIDDSIDDGDQNYAITFASAISSDPKFSGRKGADIAIVNINDDTSGVNVSPLSGLVTTEAGGTASALISLKSQPLANVSISLSSGDLTEGTVTPGVLTFTPANWNVPQQATITGVNDNISDGDVVYTIVTGTVVSADFKYAGFNPPDISVLNVDNDAYVRVQAAAGLTTTEGGGQATFGVVLNTPPAANVTISLSSDHVGEGIPSPSSLVFTPQNWNLPQTVTVTGQNDFRVDGDISYSITTTNALSSDPSYNQVKC